MKRIITTLCFLSIVFMLRAQCDINSLSDSCKHHMKPFLYGGVNAQHITLKSVPQEKEVNFPAFAGQHYRIMININSMPKGTEADIYDQDASHKKRKMLYSIKDPNGQLGICDLESKSGRLFIDFSIPAASPTLPPTGCSVVMFGYENSK